MPEQTSRPAAAIRVALPMLNLVPGGMGGSETYARELTRDLLRHDDLDVVATVSRVAAGFSEGVHEQVAEGVVGGERSSARVRALVRSATTRGLRATLRDADVVHYPLSVPLPLPPRGTPFVQTLLDVQHRDLPELFRRDELVYRSLLYDRPARRADAVITISEFSKARIVERLGVAEDRVHVAHLAVDTDRFTPHLGPREPFVLYPARGWPHKNHAVLVEAMRLVREERPELRLVLTGGALDTLGPLPPWVDVRGLVSRSELLDLYREAACLAFPSRYEGFGLPPLEAMASGCPVAAARSGSLPEVCGDAAVLFDPDDARAVAAAVLGVLAESASFVARGLEQAKRFTWQACADRHAEVYRAVVAQR